MSIYKEGITNIMRKQIDDWKSRFLSGKSKLYLMEPPTKGERGNEYHVAWTERHKKHGIKVARVGVLKDGMWCRYGVNTYCTLAGETPFDLLHGSCGPELFNKLVDVYTGDTQQLEEFDLDQLRNLTH